MKAIVPAILLSLVFYLSAQGEPATQVSASETISPQTVKGLTGKVRDVTVRAPAPTSIPPVSAVERSADIDLQRMAQWAMNYLICSPRKEFDYEPVFQANPMNCPPVPGGHDVVVACDTDARMDWEWYYMREISGSTAGKDIEAAFHKRMLAYVRADGTVLSHPGCYNETDINKVYMEKDYVYHVWGATKILHSIDNGHSHTTMPALWGIAHLGVVTGDERYTTFAKRSWDFMLSRGTGAGWFPAVPGGHPTDETCLTSDMMSNAAMIARGGHPEYFDYVERYLRNRISPCVFIVTPEFEPEYRMVNRARRGEDPAGTRRCQETSGRYSQLLRTQRPRKQQCHADFALPGAWPALAASRGVAPAVDLSARI